MNSILHCNMGLNSIDLQSRMKAFRIKIDSLKEFIYSNKLSYFISILLATFQIQSF